MSKSDAQRRSYLADQMTMGERLEALQNKVGEINEWIEEVGSVDSQYFHDELRSLGRRVGMLEKASNPGMTHFVGDDCAGGHRASPTECGRIVVDAGEWDRLMRIREAAKTVVATIDSCKGWSEYHVTFASLREALKP